MKTAIQIFIEKSIEGGWKPPTVEDSDEIPAAVRFYSNYPYRVLLDPLAWQAVGKVEGWEGTAEYEIREHANHESNLSIDAGWDWHIYQMHRMIDAIAERKTIEEFLSSLLGKE